MTSSAAATSAVVVMFLRAMIRSAEVQRHPDDQDVGPLDEAVDPVGAQAAQFFGVRRTVVPLLRLDGADDVGRSGPWFVFGEDRRADYDAVVQHGDEVSRRLSGELQQCLRHRWMP